MKRLLCLLMLLTLIAENQGFALQQCGVEWTTTLTRRMGVSPRRVVSVIDAVEVEPNHWVSADPKGGSIYINFGEDVGEQFARINSGFFYWDRALVTKDIIDQWKADNTPMSFRYKIDVSWSIRALPAYTPFLAWVPGQRDFASATELRCRTRAGWTDPDGKSWWDAIKAAKGTSGAQAWINQWGIRPDKFVSNANVNQWYPFSEGYTVDFDPAFCDTHLGAAIQFKEWRELYLDDWKFDIYETADLSAVNPCP
jgi:hypothetical protein